MTWHDYKVPVLWLEDEPGFSNDDILVFPEGMTSLMRQTRHFNGNRVALALNWAYIYRTLPIGENWKDYGITKAITPSPAIKIFLEWSMGLDVSLIENYLDTSKYFYQPERKRNKISYMIRKDPSGEILRSIFKRKGGFFTRYEWSQLKDLSEEEYSRQLVDSRIFLATSPQEGMPTSILEAMASGCIVVGFSGIGGNDFMVGKGEEQNCVLVENGDMPNLGKKIEEVIFSFRKDDHTFEHIIQNGLTTAKQFGDFNKEGESLKNFFLSLNS